MWRVCGLTRGGLGMGICEAECGVEGRFAVESWCRGAPGCGGAWCKRRGFGRGKIQPGTHSSEEGVDVCGGEVSVRPLVRPNWTVPVGHLAGRHTGILGMKTSAPSLQWSLFSPICCGGGTGLVSTRLNLLRSAFACLCAGKKELIELGLLWTVVLDLELEFARRKARVGRGTTTGVWRVQLAAIRGASD